MSDYVFGRRAEHGSWWANAVYAAVSNWQLFWLGDALAGSKPVAGLATSRGFRVYGGLCRRGAVRGALAF